MALFTGAFFVAQVSLIIVAKPFYAIFCTSCVPHHENPRILVGKVVENFYAILRDFTELYKNIGEKRRNNMSSNIEIRATLKSDESVRGASKNSLRIKQLQPVVRTDVQTFCINRRNVRLLLRLTTKLLKKSSRRSRLQKSETSLFLLSQKLPHTLE